MLQLKDNENMLSFMDCVELDDRQSAHAMPRAAQHAAQHAVLLPCCLVFHVPPEISPCCCVSFVLLPAEAGAKSSSKTSQADLQTLSAEAGQPWPRHQVHAAQGKNTTVPAQQHNELL